MENNEVRTRNDYIKNIELGMEIAFMFNDNSKMQSGKVVEINEDVANTYDEENEMFEEKLIKVISVRTRNGSIYKVQEHNISWVKLGDKWPVGIYNALKSKS